MPFLHPILFWLGLGGVSIPIIIHILNRRRHRIVDWAAMKFLLDALRKNRRRLRIEELILLALRCLIVLLLGAALARFVGCGALDQIGMGDEASSVVFILDDSFSMGQQRGKDTSFSLAIEDLSERISTLTSRDQAAILLTSQPHQENALLRMGEITDKQTLLENLSARKPSDLRTGLAQAMEAAGNILKEADSPNRRVVIFSDFRQRDLADKGQAEAIQKQMAELTENNVQVAVYDYGRPAARNLTIDGLELVGKFVTAASGDMKIRLTVQNNGTEAVQNIPVQLQATFPQGDILTSVPLPMVMIESLGPGQVWTKDVSFTPGVTGFLAVTATLPPDELPGDNSASLSLDVKKALNVLIVDGRPSLTDKTSSASFFLAHALDPNRRADHGFAVTVINYNDLTETPFDEYDVVYLLDVPRFPESPMRRKDGQIEAFSSLAALERYVANGGGVGIFTGPNLDLNFYNGRFYNEGKGLNPLKIGNPMGDVKDQEHYFSILPDSIRATGPMRIFSGSASVAVKLIRFWAITPATEGSAIASGIAQIPAIDARFDDSSKSPAVVSRTYGRGQTVAFYSTSSLLWNDWAIDAVDEVQGLYVVFMAELTEYLARPQTGELTAPAGTAISYPLEETYRDAVASLISPIAGADIISLQPIQQKGRFVLNSDKLDSIGLYRLSLQQPEAPTRNVIYARNPDPVEGQLNPAGKGEIIVAMGGDDFVYYDRTGQAQVGEDPNLARKEYWIWMIAALLALLTLETYLAWRFGHWT